MAANGSSNNTYAGLTAAQLRFIQQGLERAGHETEPSLFDALLVSKSTQASKLQDKHLPLQNPAKASNLRANAKLKQKAEQQKRLKAKTKANKLRGLLPKQQRKAGTAMQWEVALGLHRLWLGYMSELLGFDIEGAEPATLSTQAATNTNNQMDLDAPETAIRREEIQVETVQTSHHPTQQGFSSNVVAGWHAKLVKADYHGAMLTVSQTKNVAQIGLSGIVVQETSNTWSIATTSNQVKVLPKQGTIFTFKLPLKSTTSKDTRELLFSISGTQFAHRAADRATKKVKSKTKPEFGPVPAF